MIGQPRAETMLARAVAHGRVSHAYLFLGPTGVGKTTAAYLFAQAMNCERPVEAIPDATRLLPCGECGSCRRIAAGTHPDVAEVQPGSKSKQNITIEQAREIRQNTVLRPKLGRRRVYIIPQAEKFSDQAESALLKTLEEPSDSVCLILCAPNPAQLLPTVRSRCQTVRFGMAPTVEIAAAVEQLGTPPEIAAALAAASGGRPGLAIAWARRPAILEQRTDVLEVFRQALALQAEARPSLGPVALRLSEQLVRLGRAIKDTDEDSAGGRTQRSVHYDQLETALSLLRDRMILAHGGGGEVLQNRDLLDKLTPAAARPTPERALQDVRTVREAQQLLERNVTTLLVFERMFWSLIVGPVAVGPRLFEEDRL